MEINHKYILFPRKIHQTPLYEKPFKVSDFQGFNRGTLAKLRLSFHPMHKDAKILRNHLNPVMLVFIGKPSLSTHR